MDPEAGNATNQGGSQKAILVYILGVSCYFHDAAAVLLKEGQVVAAAEEERFTRKKHDFGFPRHAIDFCLQHEGIAGKDLEYVVFYEKPFLKFERILRTCLETFPKSWKVFVDAVTTWLLDKVWIKDLLREKIGVATDRILFSEHHISHAASAFFCSPFEQAAILTVDGVGEWSTTTMGIGNGNQIILSDELQFPHSLGLLYSAFTAFLGFEVNEGEYKVMGMAPYGTPQYTDEVMRVVRLEHDGSFSLDMEYFTFHYSSNRTFSRKFESLFGQPRDSNMHFFTKTSGYPSYFGEKPTNFGELADLNQRYADIAASIQRVTEDILINMANKLHKNTGLDSLCMAGGVALNSVANGRILRETPFKALYVQPSAGDGGGAMGAALHVYHTLMGNPRDFVLEHAYWGAQYTCAEISEFLAAIGVNYQYIADDEILFDRMIEDLTKGKVIGLYQGRFEWGPRALGNRSILADARDYSMKDIVNTKIKFREPYRPFAPSVLVDKAEEYFELPDAASHYPARFMLYVAPVVEEKKPVIPATTHVDGSARIQTVCRDLSPRYYRLIEKFGEATGVPVILNTSFNLRGEPIVNTPGEAYSTFSRSGIDVLVLENFVIDKDAG